jgi:hypothetical protein
MERYTARAECSEDAWLTRLVQPILDQFPSHTLMTGTTDTYTNATVEAVACVTVYFTVLVMLMMRGVSKVLEQRSVPLLPPHSSQWLNL